MIMVIIQFYSSFIIFSSSIIFCFSIFFPSCCLCAIFGSFTDVPLPFFFSFSIFFSHFFEAPGFLSALNRFFKFFHFISL